MPTPPNNLPATLTVNGVEYAVIKLLGKGKGGYSYLARAGQGAAVVVKQIHHEPCAYYQFGDKLAAELRDYQTLRAVPIPMPALLAVDQAAERLVKTYLPGPTVLELVCQNALPPDYLAQARAMAARLQGAGLNIDYFPTNFIAQNGVLHYVDYECNPYMPQWDFEHWGVKYWADTPELRAWLADHPQPTHKSEVP